MRLLVNKHERKDFEAALTGLKLEFGVATEQRGSDKDRQIGKFCLSGVFSSKCTICHRVLSFLFFFQTNHDTRMHIMFPVSYCLGGRVHVYTGILELFIGY